MKRSLLLTTVLFLALGTVWAQGPNGSGTYYQAANGLKGKALKTKLAGIIVNSKTISYDGLYEAYKKTDTRPDGYVRDWYSNTTNYRHGIDNKGSYSKEGDMYNREHSVPQSWFGSGNIKSDIVHVLPTDGYVNNRRSNYPFGEVNNATYTSNNGYCKLGSCKTPGYSSTVFEPNDEIKGDIARIYFYMITRYESSCGGWGHDVFTKTYPGLTTWTLDMMMRWSKQDPVDEREIQRNNAVFEVQGNRNPYVDYPGLEEYTWGTKMDQPFSYDNYNGAVDPNFVYAPTILPNSGKFKNSVEVTMNCLTDGASIYYTVDGSNATASATLYEGAITLTETTTINAVAVKDGNLSSQTTATFEIITGGNGDTPVEGSIGLNNTLFGTSYGGSVPKATTTDDFVGTQNGVTVTYSLGTGTYRYINDSQIRLYAGNQLTFSVSEGTIEEIEFTLPAASTKTLTASTGTVSNNSTWTGNAQSVTFSVNDGSGNMQLSGAKVKLSSSEPTVISTTPIISEGEAAWYTLDGRMLQSKPTQKGVYIMNGKKIVIK